MNKLVKFGIGIAALIAAAPAMAQHSFTLEDGNSLVHFNTDPAFLGTRIGMDRWEVDGTNHMFNQWFWFRIGNAPEQRLNSLPRTFAGVFNTNPDPRNDTFTVTYRNALVEVESTFRLTGGSSGSGTSDVTESIRITNVGTSPLDFHFFQYCDLDLNNDIVDDFVGISNAPNFNIATQTDGAAAVTETSALPYPSTREVNTYANTINALDDGFAGNLNGNPGPLGGPIRLDYTWAFQWDFILAPGDSFLISKDKLLTPAPGTIALLGMGGLFAARRRRA